MSLADQVESYAVAVLAHLGNAHDAPGAISALIARDSAARWWESVQ